MSTEKVHLQGKYQWTYVPEFKSIRHAISSELKPTEEEKTPEIPDNPEFAAFCQLFKGIGRREVIGDYDSNVTMDHNQWVKHYTGDAADDLAALVKWNGGIKCSVGYVNSIEDDFVVNFVEPEPFIAAETVTADTVRELVDAVTARLPLSIHPDLLIPECCFITM